MKALTFPFLLFTALVFAQNNSQNDSITQLDEVILLDALKTKNAIGIEPSSVISAQIFQNYSPADLVSSVNQKVAVGFFNFCPELNTIFYSYKISIKGQNFAQDLAVHNRGHVSAERRAEPQALLARVQRERTLALYID